MFCSYCGKEIADGARFCRYCGMKQPEVDVKPIPVVPPAPAAPINKAAPAAPEPDSAPQQDYRPAYSAPQAPQAAPQTYAYTAPAPVRKKSSPLKIVIPIAVLVILAAVGVLFVLPRIQYGDTAKVLAKAAGYGQSQKALAYLDKAVKTNKDEAIKTERDRLYNSQWKIGKRYYYNESTNTDSHREYNYDSDGKLSNISYYEEDGDYSYEITVEQQGPNHELWKWTYSNGFDERNTEVFYNGQGLETLHRYVDRDGNIESEWYSLYNGHGDLVLEASLDSDEEYTGGTFFKYEYTPDSRKKTMTVCESSSEEPAVIEYIYSDDGAACDLNVISGTVNYMHTVREEYEFIPLPENAEPEGDAYAEKLRLLEDGETLQSGDITYCYIEESYDGYTDTAHSVVQLNSDGEAEKILGGHSVGETFDYAIGDDLYKIEIIYAARPAE